MVMQKMKNEVKNDFILDVDYVLDGNKTLLSLPPKYHKN